MKEIDDSAAPSAFVLMPFDPDFRAIYDLFIRETLQTAGYRVARADDLVTQRSILQDIIESVRLADLVLADLTGGNPNVFYELGLAHAFGRSVILLSQDLADVPFDLRGYRVVLYDTHFAKIPKAQAELLALAQAFRAGRLPVGNPVSDYLPRMEHRPRKEPAAGTSPPPPLESHKADAEHGFLDFLVIVEEGLGELTQIVHGIAGATNEIGELTSQFTTRMTNLTSSHTPGGASVLRQLARDLGQRVVVYANTLQGANERYRELWTQVGPSLEGLIASSTPREEEDRLQLQKFLEHIDTLAGQTKTARASYASLADTMSGAPGMERQLNQALNTATAQARAFVDNLDQTIASLERAHTVGKSRLES